MSVSRISSDMLRLFTRKSKPIMLGRWGVQHSARKAELANHDHCGGPQCSKTSLTKTEVDVEEYDSSMDVAICALQSFHAHPVLSRKK